jgi:hypothetical protein
MTFEFYIYELIKAKSNNQRNENSYYSIENPIPA